MCVPVVMGHFDIGHSVHVPVELDSLSLFHSVNRTRTTGFKITFFWDVMPCSLVGRSVTPWRNLLPFVFDEDRGSTLVVAVGPNACGHMPEDLDSNVAVRNSNNTFELN